MVILKIFKMKLNFDFSIPLSEIKDFVFKLWGFGWVLKNFYKKNDEQSFSLLPS